MLSPDIELKSKPDFEKAMDRIYAWYQGGILDRAPVGFSPYNTFSPEKPHHKSWASLKKRWFDVEYIVEDFIDHISKTEYLAETFPVYMPNLGPNWFAACHGSPLVWGEDTTWTEPIIQDYEKDFGKIRFDRGSEAFRQMDTMTKYALERSDGNFLVGYTDFHPGIDCAAAWRDSQMLLMDLYDDKENVKRLLDLAEEHFFEVYEYFDSLLKGKKQLSVTWLNIPSFETMHVPSADFSSMISTEMFDEFVMLHLANECRNFTYNVFHVDGKGVARHLGSILTLPNVQAIQWVQGAGEDAPIIKWIPLIKKVLKAGKSVCIYILPSELEELISSFDTPEGLFLNIASSDPREQKEIIKCVQKW